MRIAILGGGGVGVCAALELARYGLTVDVYEQDARPLMRASRVNEGKIHQGFLYANDPTARTAQVLAEGALAFTACLARWIAIDPATLRLSTPFVYAVHKSTMVSLDKLERHYADCRSLFEGLRAATGLRYLGRDEPFGFRRLPEDEAAAVLDPAELLAAFITSERAIDPRAVADELRVAFLAEPRIAFKAGCRVSGVRRAAGSRFFVTFGRGGGQEDGPYDQVVNALWEGRLAIDRKLGIVPSRTWIYRHKFGTRVNVALEADDLPSVTMVLGPFGDIVNFGANGIYLSWYPIGMVATTSEIEPPPGWTDCDEAFRYDVFERSFHRWARVCPKLARLKPARETIDPSSGVIFAWGDTDIDDPASELHARYEIGIRSVDGYHSVNTGKYTMVPYLGLKAAERVLGADVKLEPA